MPNIDPAMMQQAMMQGAMGMGGPPQEAAEPALDQGDTTPEERAGRGGDTLIAHVTPGEVVVPMELISNEMAMRKLRSLFEKHDVNMDQYTVGHESNSINPETGNPEFSSWRINDLTGSKRKGRKAGRKAASQEAAIQRKKIQKMITAFNAKMAAGKKQLLAESKAQKKKMIGEGLAQNLKFKSKLSSIAKEKANLGAPAGVTSAASVPMTEQPKGKSSWRRARKRRNKVMQRRPGL